MDLKELKKLTHHARKCGIKFIKMGDFEMELDHSAPPSRPMGKLKRLAPLFEEKSPEIPQEPTLDQINQFIYSNVDEAV